MTSGITARDKKLLYGLGIIVIIALFYIIGIRPINRKIKTLNTNIEDAQVIHDSIKMKIYHLDMIKEFETTAKKKVDELSSRYYETMVPADVDKMITSKALGRGLKVVNLSIRRGDSPAILSAYVNSQVWQEHQKVLEQSVSDATIDNTTTTESQTTTSATTENATATTEALLNIETLASINDDTGMYKLEDTSSSGVYATSLVLDVYGDKDKAQLLLDELINDKSINVTAYEWSDMTTLPYQYVNGELVKTEDGVGARLVVSFDMFMYDGSDYEELIEGAE
ncbi:MAG: type II secretion system protein M [Lachnospiraceae bacterium]|nr:type II secretion system protein M [Lachnospiraceae bacterium]